MTKSTMTTAQQVQREIAGKHFSWKAANKIAAHYGGEYDAEACYWSFTDGSKLCWDD